MPDSTLGKIIVELAAAGGPITSGGGFAASGIRGGADSQAKEQIGLLTKMRDGIGKVVKNAEGQPRWWSKAFKSMGIQMGMAGVLKQSQIFTSTLGAIFQILGAFIDVLLAPFMPMIVPAIRLLAKQIPTIRKFANRFAEWVKDTAIPKIISISKAIKDKTIAIWNTTKSFFDTLFSPYKWIEVFKRMWDGLVTHLKALWDELLGGKKFWKFTLPSFGPNGDKPRENGSRSSGEDRNGDRRGGQDKNGMSTVEQAVLLAAGVKTLELVGDGVTRAAKLVTPGIMHPMLNAMNKMVKAPGQIMTWGAKTLTKGTITALDELQSRARGGGKRFTGKPPTATTPKPPPRTTTPLDDWTTPSRGKRFTGMIDDWEATFDSSPRAKPPPRNITPLDDWGGTGISDKFRRAQRAFIAFKTWLSGAWSKLLRGGDQVKPVVARGLSLAKTMLTASPGTSIARTAARAAARFLRVIPFLGAAYMGAETTFELKKIAEDPRGWTGDLTSANAWLTEAKGNFASMIGSGFLRKVGGILPGPVGEFFKGKGEVLERWKQAQQESGAISGGKALDFGIRAITGYGGAAASFLPLIGQLIGAGVYEGGRYVTTGIGLWDDKRLGGAKYGTEEMSGEAIDMIMKFFGARNAPSGPDIATPYEGVPSFNISLDGVNGMMAAGVPAQ